MPTEHPRAGEIYEDASGAYCEGRFEDAMAGFSELVASGNAMAATYLAEMYLRGEGASHDVEKGLELLERAVAWGHADAAFNLGAYYRTGDCGVPKDSKKCRHFFVLAKQLGCELPIEDYIR